MFKNNQPSWKRIVPAIVLAGAMLWLAEFLSARTDDPSPDAATLLARAMKAEDLRADGVVPFLLEADLTVVSGKQEYSGQYRLKWWSSNRWQEFVKLADFARSRDGVPGGYWQVRTTPFQRRVIFDIDEVLDAASVLRITPTEAAGIPRVRTFGGSKLSCVPISLRISGKTALARELCFDPGSEMLVHAEFPRPGKKEEDRDYIDYSGSIALGERRFPSKAVFSRKGMYSLEVTITRLEAVAAPPPAAPAPGSHGEFWNYCRDGIPYDSVYVPSPSYPEKAAMAHEQGLVSFYVHIEADGTVSHVTTLNAPSPLLEKAAVETVQRWKIKPGSCGGVPVMQETIIEFTFRLFP